MAWGFGTGHVHYPAQVEMLANPLPVTKIQAIISAVQAQGAAAGWDAMMRTSKIPGLGYGFGTKVLYFAGYGRVNNGPQPLILDSKVSSSLANVAGFKWNSSYDKKASDYMAYLNLAAQWAQDPTWQNGSEEAVEFALFS